MNSGAPYYYDYSNIANSAITPSTVHIQNTQLQAYFRRYLLQKAMSVYKWKMPKTWSKDYFLYSLYCWGFVSVVNTDKFGVIPQACGLRGFDVFYRPTNAIITNPLLKGILEPVIGQECTLFKLQADYGSIMDLINYYADMLALCAESAGMNIVNSKLSYVFTAKNKAAAESFKKIYDRVASGEVAVVFDKNLLNDDGTPAWQTFAQNLKENYIAPDILSDMRKWEEKFDTEIGIPNANTDKRERLITDEVNANNVEVISRSEMWLENLKQSAEETRNMFGIDIDVDWRVKPCTQEKPKEDMNNAQ